MVQPLSLPSYSVLIQPEIYERSGQRIPQILSVIVKLKGPLNKHTATKQKIVTKTHDRSRKVGKMQLGQTPGSGDPTQNATTKTKQTQNNSCDGPWKETILAPLLKPGGARRRVSAGKFHHRHTWGSDGDSSNENQQHDLSPQGQRHTNNEQRKGSPQEKPKPIRVEMK